MDDNTVRVLTDEECTIVNGGSPQRAPIPPGLLTLQKYLADWEYLQNYLSNAGVI